MAFSFRSSVAGIPSLPLSAREKLRIRTPTAGPSGCPSGASQPPVGGDLRMFLCRPIRVSPTTARIQPRRTRVDHRLGDDVDDSPNAALPWVPPGDLDQTRGTPVSAAMAPTDSSDPPAAPPGHPVRTLG